MTATTVLPPNRYLALLESDGARLAAAARGRLDAAVPSCPGWTVDEAVRHTGAVYHHKIASIRLQRRPEEGEWATGPGEGEDLVDWYESALTAVLDELRTQGPAAPSFTWWPPDQTVGFWYRRMAQETAVHRVDVESAVGDVTPVDHDLAVDGIDEVLTVMLSGDWSEQPVPDASGRTVAVRTAGHGWLVALHPEQVEVGADEGHADAVVTGEPSELLLWAWGRRPRGAVLASGPEDLVTELRARLAAATD